MENGRLKEGISGYEWDILVTQVNIGLRHYGDFRQSYLSRNQIYLKFPRILISERKFFILLENEIGTFYGWQ